MPSFHIFNSPQYCQSFVLLLCVSNLYLLTIFYWAVFFFLSALLKYLFIKDIILRLLSLNVFFYPVEIFHFISAPYSILEHL